MQPLRKLLTILAFAGLVISACTATQDVPTGQELYETGGSSGIPCSSCHTLDGTDFIGPSLQGVGSQAADRVAVQDAETYIRESITAPGAFIVEGFENTMTASYGASLSDEEIDTLTAYLLTQ